MPIRTLFQVYSNKYQQPLFIGSRNNLYEITQHGFLIGMSRKKGFTNIGINFGIEGMKITGLSCDFAKAIDFSTRLVDRIEPFVFIEPNLLIDYLDDKLNPKSGFLTVASVKGMFSLRENDYFLKFLIEQSFFYPLFSSMVLALRFRFGHILNEKFCTLIPSERYYLGGANSLRGYETNMAPPLEKVICDRKKLFVPVGGKTMANVNAELRFPLYRRLSGVLFTDMGILVQDRIADIAANKWLGASGFGLRFASPIGPIRFDIGWKWKKREPDDKRYAFFFTFGHAF